MARSLLFLLLLPAPGCTPMHAWLGPDPTRGIRREGSGSSPAEGSGRLTTAWYNRLRMGKYTYQINHAMVSTVDALGLAPKGLKDVHHMLVEVARSLVAGGETGVFTPMHLLLFHKPAEAGKK